MTKLDLACVALFAVSMVGCDMTAEDELALDSDVQAEYSLIAYDGPWDRVDEHYDRAGLCVGLDTSTTTVVASDEEGSCKGSTASSKKSDARLQARNDARTEASFECEDIYNVSSFSRSLYDLVCEQTCSDRGLNRRGGSELQLCDDRELSVDFRYEAKGCGSRPFRSKKWFADVEIEGSCGCVCD